MTNIIDVYKKDIEKLNSIKQIYNNTQTLNGGFYSDMINEINLQIKHCESCINNLKNY